MIQCQSIGTGAAEVIVQAQSEQAMKSTQKELGMMVIRLVVCGVSGYVIEMGNG